MMKRGAVCSELKMFLHLGGRERSVLTEVSLVTADFFEEREKEEAREQENIFDDIIIKCRVIGFRV
jgi:hypothetical protein